MITVAEGQSAPFTDLEALQSVPFMNLKTLQDLLMDLLNVLQESQDHQEFIMSTLLGQMDDRAIACT